ncbi:MAG: NTPase, partial [Candidatus Marinimicrobia bacterium]|nr:NTPase [Candidatus Neomarinimicrobiota bacterium]
MKYKLNPIEIPPDNPFANDALDRKESVESVAALIEELPGPFVLAINSPWGTGKTTFVKFVKTILEAKGIACVYFSAWETDFASDPMIAFLGELEVAAKGFTGKKRTFKANFDKVKSIASIIAKKAIPVAGKIATAGILDISAFTEGAIAKLVEESINDVVSAYGKEKDLMEKFREKLAASLDALTGNGNSSPVIIFVDDLDRCRPTYAIELLERIKHLFDVENAIFVLSLDKQQLGVNLMAVYGQGINSNEYLRRFIDLEYLLPKTDSEKFTLNLFQRFG